MNHTRQVGKSVFTERLLCMRRFRGLAFFMAFLCMVLLFPIPVYADGVEVEAPSVLLMEAESGTVLYEKNADEVRHPASVTKVMTLLLVFEAIDSGKIKMTDAVTVSDRAASMGGSQVFLEVGEKMSVEDMVKSVVVCSANDAAVALAEFVAGSESAFVDQMNAKALALGMKNTHFDNTNGLDDTTETHLTSSRDIALMSRELIVNHPSVLNYTTIWQDTIRGGAFTLTNTNKLVRFYSGANGLKTGFTSKSGYCISATAKRDGLQLIAVIMGAESSDKRNLTAKRLFDYGFANYSYVELSYQENVSFRVTGGVKGASFGKTLPLAKVLPKEKKGTLNYEIQLAESVTAPVYEGDVIGKIVYKSKDLVIAEADITAGETISKMTFFGLLKKALSNYLMLE